MPTRRAVALITAVAFCVLPSLPTSRALAAAPSVPVVINEVQVQGAGGATDEFVELYNGGATVAAIGGWKLKRSSSTGGTTATLATIPIGTRLSPNSSYLLAADGYDGASDQTYASSIASGGGVALMRADGSIIDALGMSAKSAYIEGRAVPTAPAGTSLQRQPDGADTNDNLADFASAPPTPARSRVVRPNTVIASDSVFKPARVVVTEGDSVFWHNGGATTHTVRADNGSFDSGNIAKNAWYAAPLKTVGTFAYYCAIHGGPGGKGMAGQVVVLPRRGRWHRVAPTRVLDAYLDQGVTRIAQVTGAAGIPVAGVSAVLASVTVSDAAQSGQLLAWPASDARPPSGASVSFVTREPTTTTVSSRLSRDGALALFNTGGRAHLQVDVLGYVDRWPDGADGRVQFVAPTRVLDSRSGRPFTAGEIRTLQLGGVAGIPSSDVAAAIVNVTAVSPTATGSLTAWPAGETRPAVPAVRFSAGRIVANRVVVPLGSTGRISVYNATGSTDVVVDVTGWVTRAGVGRGAIASTSPVRVYAKRLSSSTTVTIAPAGVPSDASGVVLAVTAANAERTGWLTVWPAGSSRPPTSDVLFMNGRPATNLVVARVGTGGAVSLGDSNGAVDVTVDLVGYVT